MNDAQAAQLPMHGVREERAQLLRGLHASETVQVQLRFNTIFAAPESPDHGVWHAGTPIIEFIQRLRLDHGTGRLQAFLQHGLAFGPRKAGPCGRFGCAGFGRQRCYRALTGGGGNVALGAPQRTHAAHGAAKQCKLVFFVGIHSMKYIDAPFRRGT